MLAALLPRVEYAYGGSRWSLYFLGLLTLISTLRSLVHLLAPDGGAHSIAGIELAVAGGVNIVALFGQWGASQLVLALMQWTVVLRYQFLVPAMLLIVIVEQILRITAGQLKPLQISTAPPGAYGTYITLALALIFLWMSVKRQSATAKAVTL